MEERNDLSHIDKMCDESLAAIERSMNRRTNSYSVEPARVDFPIEKTPLAYEGEILDGRYELVEILADGRENGQGIVAKAIRNSDGRPVVVKQYSEAESSGSWDSLERAEVGAAREISFLKRANRDGVRNIPMLLEYGVTGRFIRQPVAIFDYIPGRKLQDIVADPDYDPSLEFIRRVAEDITEPLEYAHESNARPEVHREVNPKNIMVNGESSCLIDWATVKSTSGKTEFGTQFVTLNYTAPEILASKEFDGRADQYSLGKVLQFMLAGEDLFEATDGNPSPEHFENLNVPRGTIEVLARATAQKPAERYRTIREFYNAFSGSFRGLEEKLEETNLPEVTETSEEWNSTFPPRIMVGGIEVKKGKDVSETVMNISEATLVFKKYPRTERSDVVSNLVYAYLQHVAKDNLILTDALEGRRTLEDAVRESSMKKDKKRINQLQEISSHSQKAFGGFWNRIPSFISMVVGGVASPTIFIDILHLRDIYNIYTLPAIFLGVFSGDFLEYYVTKKRNKRKLLKQARELDGWIHQARVSQGPEKKVEDVSFSD